jgi:uncharacterized protein with GYD domain
MPSYVVLYRFTDEGRRNIKNTIKRAAEIRRENEARGFRLLGTWWTQGQYDLVAVVESPSEQAMLSGLYNIAEAGNVSSETMRAFTQAEVERALGSAGSSGSSRSAGRSSARKAGTRRAAPRRTASTRRRTTRRRS